MLLRSAESPALVLGPQGMSSAARPGASWKEILLLGSFPCGSLFPVLCRASCSAEAQGPGTCTLCSETYLLYPIVRLLLGSRGISRGWNKSMKISGKITEIMGQRNGVGDLAFDAIFSNLLILSWGKRACIVNFQHSPKQLSQDGAQSLYH